MVAGGGRAVGMSGTRVRGAGVVTCVVVEAVDAAPVVSEIVEATFLRAGAAVVMAAGTGFVGAFQRVTDAVHASLALRAQLPASRMAMCTGETGTHGEFGPIAEKATRLVAEATAGSTLLSRVAGALAVDHLPRNRQLREFAGTEPCFELLDGASVSV